MIMYKNIFNAVAAGRGIKGGICPGCQQMGKSGYGNFLRHKISKNSVSSVEAGMGTE